MGDMNRNISQNRIAILAVSQYVKNRNNIEAWPKYRNTIESSHFCQFPPLVFIASCHIVLCICARLSLFECSYLCRNTDELCVCVCVFMCFLQCVTAEQN